ncbi:MAG: MFS transporter [Candidatus Bathyarchaeota archaeon]|nr:MFS transporter [Candidatus Bathyarchaeota archaeon]
MNRLMAYGRDILILSVIFLVGSLAIDMITPIWPIYIKSSLGASMTELGFVFSVSSAVAAVTQILSGFLSDKYGRKRLHVLGTLLIAFPPLMYALASDWTDLVPWVMLSGFATGLYLPVRWAIVADVSSTETMASAYSWTNISWLVGFTIAPFVGGITADLFGIRSPFFLCFILGLAVFPLTLLMQETRRRAQVKGINKETASERLPDVTDRYLLTVVLFSLINIIQGLGLGVTGPVIPVFVVSNFPVDYTFIGILYAIGFGVASIIVQIPGGKCSDLFDRRKVMFLTFVASSPFFLLFAYSRSMLELILFMFLSRAILNLSWSPFQTLMMDATPASKWGLINGVSAATFWIGLLMGNAFSGILWDSWGMIAPFYASSFAIGLSALPLLLLKETRANTSQ